MPRATMPTSFKVKRSRPINTETESVNGKACIRTIKVKDYLKEFLKTDIVSKKLVKKISVQVNRRK